jgi:hypothetical protein
MDLWILFNSEAKDAMLNMDIISKKETLPSPAYFVWLDLLPGVSIVNKVL